MNKVTIGVIGAGRIGKVHLDNIITRLPNIRVKYVCDLLIETDLEMRKFVQDRVTPECILTTDYHVVMSDPEVQAIMCLVATNAHVEVCLSAIHSKKQIFCEKPVAMELSETQMLLEESTKAGLLFQVGFNRRFDHNFKAIRDAVAAGKIGRPTMIHVISRDPTYDIGYIRRSIEEGGMFVDMTIHDFDMVQYVAGPEDPIVEVFAWGAALVAPEDIGSLGDVDTAVVTLRTKSGVMATIDNTRKAVYGYDQRLEAVGTKGCIGCDNDRPTTCRMMVEDLPTQEDRIKWWFMERYPEAFIAEEREFFKLVAEGGKGVPPVTIQDMIRAMNVANAANESLKTGLPVKVPQI